MATYYVNASTGNDSNDGSSGTPFLTLAKCVTVAAANDTFNLAGTFRESADFRDKGDNITIQQWAGQTVAWILGDTVLATWTNGVNIYTKTIATGLTVHTVVVDWFTSIATTGQHYGHLTRAASAAAVATTDNSWFYDSGTGLMTIRIGADLDPAGFTVSYVFDNLLGIRLGSTTSAQVAANWHNLNFGLWCASGAGFGYSVKCDNSSNSRASGNMYHDCGYHAQGFTNGVNALMSNNVESGSSCFGITAAGDSAFVCYSEEEGMGGVRSGFDNCYVRLGGFLGRDQLPIAMRDPVTLTALTTCTPWGFICHTSGSGTTITNFECRDCLVNVNTAHSSMQATNRMGSYKASHTAAPSNPWDWETYAARFVRCNSINGVTSATTDSAAFVYCSFDMAQAGTSGVSRVDNPGSGVFGGNGSNNTNLYVMYHGCDMRANIDISSVSANHSAIFRCSPAVSTTVDVYLIGCSVLNTSQSTAAQVRAIFNQVVLRLPTIHARQCIFAHRIAAGTNLNQLTYNNTGTTAATLDFSNCWYVNIAATRYASAVAYDTPAEWTASIDPASIHGTISPFLDFSGTTPLELNAYAKTQTAQGSPSLESGINWRAYDNSHGAYQYGDEAGFGTTGGRLARGWNVR